MRKRSYFDLFDHWTWPDPKELERYFLAPPGQRWTFETGNDSWGLSLEGVDGSEHFTRIEGRIDICLDMWGHPVHGVMLIHSKSGGGHRDAFYSRGDLTRLREWVLSLHGDPMPVGLFIPYEQAWSAVKKFIETDGAFPQSIEWIAERELPPNIFPDRFHIPTS